MKIKGDITFLVNRESTTIEIRDRNANVFICTLELTPEDLSAMLSRQGNVKCDIEVYKPALDRIGKTHENKYFEFEIPEELYEYNNRDPKKLKAIADALLTDGWIADSYFGSQNSFFENDGKKYARCTIRRWI